MFVFSTNHILLFSSPGTDSIDTCVVIPSRATTIQHCIHLPRLTRRHRRCDLIGLIVIRRTVTVIDLVIVDRLDRHHLPQIVVNMEVGVAVILRIAYRQIMILVSSSSSSRKLQRGSKDRPSRLHNSRNSKTLASIVMEARRPNFRRSLTNSSNHHQITSCPQMEDMGNLTWVLVCHRSNPPPLVKCRQTPDILHSSHHRK